MNINYLEALSIIPRSILSLAVLFLITKIIGKKQVSELSLFDYVIGISIGNFSAEMTLNMSDQYLNGIIAIIVFGFVATLVSYITMKSIVFRRIFIGLPTVIVEDGKILINGLKKAKIDINDFLEQCRCNGYFNIEEIAYAIMEANGKISFLLKDEYNNATKTDVLASIKKSTLEVNAIIDGKLMFNNIKNSNLTESFIYKELDKQKVKLEDVLLGVINNKKLIIFKKNTTTARNILE